ncbi:MAG: CoA transferase subunit A [Chloroflexi bacterium]|nr:CoA transferase subunit A [Chloroflexota bacterium]
MSDKPEDLPGIKPTKPITERDFLPIEVRIAPPPQIEMPPPPPDEDAGSPRPNKRLELAEAIERFVPDGVASLALGGMHMHHNPMGLVRELVRQQKHIRRLITSPAGCINADLLIGAGLVEEIVTSYVGFEHLGLAPAYRRFAQEGRLRVLEVDEMTLVLALRAGVSNQPFAALPPGVALTGLPRANPAFYQPVTDPFTGRTVLATPALRPQVALVYASQADRFGNATYKGAAFLDREIIMASQSVVLQVEQVVSNSQLTANPLQVTVPSFYVDAVVAARFSCHPTSSHRFYQYDTDHLQEYLRLAATEKGFEEYLDKYIRSSPTEKDYLSLTSLG